MFALSKILVVCYGISWVACGWFGATHGVVGLALAATLLTLPFFLISSAYRMLAGFLISALIGLLIFVFPPLAFLAGVWAGISLVLKIIRLVRNFVPMAAGVGLYALVAVVPRILSLAYQYRDCAHWVWFLPVAALFLFAGGAAIMNFALFALERLGYKRNLAAAVMLGFPAYLAIFLITMLLPGPSDGDGDADACHS